MLPQISHNHQNRNFSSIFCNFLDQLLHPYEFYGRGMSVIPFWPIPASRLWPKKVENFTFEWLQLLVQTCYQQVFDWCFLFVSRHKFFVKVKIKVHVTIGHVCDFARNYGPAPNDFKVNILWCVMEFCIEQYTDDGQHIYKQFHILRMKFYHQDFFWCNILFGHVCDILV